MPQIDLSPLFRSAIGFDRLAALIDAAYRTDSGGYPPYNIELTAEHRYRITMAVAGFTRADLELVVEHNILSVTGARPQDDDQRQFLHRGIANRGFRRQFQLADYVRVASADLRDGLLHIDLVRELPEANKPRRIRIHGDPRPGED
jgi:molecular chaperone IbpA